MLWQDRNGTWHSTVSAIDMKITKNTKKCAKTTDNLNLWEEMFGKDSAYMEDQFGG